MFKKLQERIHHVRRGERERRQRSFFNPGSCKKAKHWRDNPTFMLVSYPKAIEIPGGGTETAVVNLVDSITVVKSDDNDEVILNWNKKNERAIECEKEDLLQRTAWKIYGCECCVEEKESHFPIAMHTLEGKVVHEWECDSFCQRLKVLFNHSFYMLGPFEVGTYESSTERMEPEWFYSISQSLREIRCFILPRILNDVTMVLKKKLRALKQREDYINENNVGLGVGVVRRNLKCGKKNFMSYCIKLSATFYMVGNRMINCAKDYPQENLYRMFAKHLSLFNNQEDWKDYLQVDPWQPMENDEGNPRYHTIGEIQNVIDYVDIVLLPLLEENVISVADSWNDVQERKLEFNEEEILLWRDEEKALNNERVKERSLREPVRIRQLTKDKMVEIAFLCGVAGNILHMLPTASSAEYSGLEYIFLDGLFKKNIDNICNVCGNLNGGLHVLGLSVGVEDDE